MKKLRLSIGIGSVVALLSATTVVSYGKDGSSPGANTAQGQTLTIYSSLPLQGDSRPQSVSVSNGIKLALKQAGNKVGDFTLRYRSLDDATAALGKWDPRQTSNNARRAARDRSAIAYLGEFNSGASVVSMPLINQAGILQVSPSNTYVGLTRSEGADEGEPNKYFPTGKRTYGRVVPADHIQAAAQVTYMREQGCNSVYILNDTEVYGKGLADQVAKLGPSRGLAVRGNDGIDTKAANFRAVADKIKNSGAECFFFGGITANKGAQVFTDVHAASPNMKLFGPDGVTESPFSTSISPSVQAKTYLTVAVLDPKSYPKAAQNFYTAYRREYNATPEPYAIYGYEAMSVVLAAMRRAGDKANNRAEVVKQFFATKNRTSVLGRYSIDRNGDTTLTDYGAYRVRNGALSFSKVIKAQT